MKKQVKELKVGECFVFEGKNYQVVSISCGGTNAALIGSTPSYDECGDLNWSNSSNLYFHKPSKDDKWWRSQGRTVLNDTRKVETLTDRKRSGMPCELRWNLTFNEYSKPFEKLFDAIDWKPSYKNQVLKLSCGVSLQWIDNDEYSRICIDSPFFSDSTRFADDKDIDLLIQFIKQMQK